MDLPNYQWLPLAVVFVDWDRLVAWVRRRRAADPSPDSGPPAPPRPVVSLLIAGFAALHLAITFGPVGLDQRLSSYPISQYKMFSQVRAKRPYAVHQTWELETMRFTADARSRAARRALGRLASIYYKKGYTRSPEEVEKILRQARRRSKRERDLADLTAWYTILQAPAHPAPPDVVPYPIGILGRLRGDRFESLLGTSGRDEAGRPYVAPAPVGLELPADLTMTVLIGLDPVPRPIAMERSGDRFYYTPAELGRHLFIAEVGSEPFVVAQVRHRRP